MEPLQQLREAFTSILNLPIDTDFSSVNYGKTAGWSSIAHMKLIAHLEKVFSVMLEVDDIIGMSSFEEAKKILTRHDIKF